MVLVVEWLIFVEQQRTKKNVAKKWSNFLRFLLIIIEKKQRTHNNHY